LDPPEGHNIMLTGIAEIDQETYSKCLDFSIKSSGNLMVFGPAGVGKTEMAMQAAERSGYASAYLNLSTIEAPDMIGLPQVVDGRTCYATPDMIPLYNPNEKPIVLIVDELDKAKPELQNPCLELFQFRSLNGRKTNIHSVIATGNLPDEGAFSQPVSRALTNRCSIYRLTHSYGPWSEWALNAQVNPLVISFLSKNQELLLQPPPSGDCTAYASCSPRSWSLAARDLDFAADKDVNFQSLLVASRVGTAASIQFRVWLEHYRFIAPIVDDLVEKGKHPDISSMTIDRILVCAISALNAVAQTCRENVVQGTTAKKKAAISEKMVNVTNNVCKWLDSLDSEYCIGALKSVLSSQMIDQYRLVEVPAFMKVILKVRQADR